MLGVACGLSFSISRIDEDNGLSVCPLVIWEPRERVPCLRGCRHGDPIASSDKEVRRARTSHKLKALYQGGVFVPQEPCDVPEGSEVELIIRGPLIIPPQVKTAKERQHILRMMIERMRQNPLPVDGPPLTREALHERR